MSKSRKGKHDRRITPHRCSAIWHRYAQFRRGQVAPSTSFRDYRKIERRIARMARAAPELASAVEIRDWLLDNYAAETARRTLVQLNACCKWAKESEMLEVNAFEGLQKHIIASPPGERAWVNFELDERDRIIQAFNEEHPFYAPWVRFCFWTGCRPEEARALVWDKHVAGDCSEILFAEAWPVDVPEPQSIKNYKVTRFPCNPRLMRLLRAIRPDDLSLHVFRGREEGPFDYHNFQTRIWKPLVERLVKEGQVAFYLPQVHMRHTWITAAIDRPELSVKDVAYLARVSPSTIYKHYAGRARRPIVPEF